MGEKGNVPAEAASLVERVAGAAGDLAGVAGTTAVAVGVERGIDHARDDETEPEEQRDADGT